MKADSKSNQPKASFLISPLTNPARRVQAPQQERKNKFRVLTWATSILLLFPATQTQAQTAERIADLAKGITVRIEGATQGSGSLYKKEGNRYTVITAWHVLSSNNQGEDIDIVIRGKTYKAERFYRHKDESIDIGFLTFKSQASYQPPKLGGPESAKMGSEVFVSGFPLETSAVQERILRFSDGRVIANARTRLNRGYQLLYSNFTWPGMSGGPVLNKLGELVGIHGQSEIDKQLTMQRGIAVKTGTNQGVPILLIKNAGPTTRETQARFSADDFVVFSARAINMDADKEAIFYAKKANQIRPSDKAYQYIAMASMSEAVKDPEAAVVNAKASLRLNPKNYHSYTILCFAYVELGIPIPTRRLYNRLATNACKQSLKYNNNDQDTRSFTLSLLEVLER